MAAPVREQLHQEVSDTFQELINTLSAFKEEQFNLAPYEGSWTPGQIAEHLIKSVSAIPDEHTQATQRAYDQMVKPISDLFLNFTIKMTSPDFVQPGNGPHDKKDIIVTFTGIRQYLQHAVQTTDLEATCVGFEMPTIGLLTRYEWIKFFIVHTQRHTRQLKAALVTLSAAA